MLQIIALANFFDILFMVGNTEKDIHFSFIFSSRLEKVVEYPHVTNK